MRRPPATGPAGVVIDVCVTCRSAVDDEPVGQSLKDALTEACAGHPGIAVRAVPCLAVCDRPTTVAFRAPGKWSYVIGDVPADGALDDIVAVALAISRARHGIPMIEDRPEFFRRGVVARVPPEAGIEDPAEADRNG